MRRQAAKGLIATALVSASLGTVWLVSRQHAATITVTDLRCESRKDPLGVNEARPRLSWILNSNARGEAQSAYQVLAASTIEALKVDRGDWWDSGKVPAGQSIHVRYGGKPLPAHAQAFWKVRVWNKLGKPSDWSEAARWSVGPVARADWRAQWIGLNGDDVEAHLVDTSWIDYPETRPEKSAGEKIVFFRRVVHVPEGRPIKRAVFQYTGDRECSGWLNESDLGARNDSRTVKWHELTNRLESGKSYVFGLVGRSLGAPSGVIGLLTIEFASGEPLIIRTDEHWKASERDDAGWRSLDFDDTDWSAARVLGPAGMAPWGPTRTAEDHGERHLRRLVRAAGRPQVDPQPRSRAHDQQGRAGHLLPVPRSRPHG